MVFPAVMYGCESWTVKIAECRRIDAFELWFKSISSQEKTSLLKRRLLFSREDFSSQEKTLESPLNCKEIQPVHPGGDQSWVFIGRTDVEAETPILWPPYAKS